METRPEQNSNIQLGPIHFSSTLPPTVGKGKASAGGRRRKTQHLLVSFTRETSHGAGPNNHPLAPPFLIPNLVWWYHKLYISMLVDGRITPQRTYYEILSVSEDAGIDEIRTGYRAALLSTHPDKVSKCPPDLSEPGNNGHEFFIVQKAWEVLGNSQSKSRYDKELAASRRKVDVVANEIELEDMNLEINDDGVCELVHLCRCGDCFGIGSSELEEMGVLLGENGEVQVNDCDVVPVSVILQCGSCSLKVRLLIEVNV